jgi:hypothetical protein
MQGVLAKGVPFRFRVGGRSMLPFIQDGDVVTVSALCDASPGIGDVIAFVHPETKKLLVHRVSAKTPFFIFPKGDNALQVDGMVPPQNILGRVVTVERNGREVSLGLGPERSVLAFLVRRRFFHSWIYPLWALFRPFFKRPLS